MSKYFYYHLLIFGGYCYIVYNITYFSRFLPFPITKDEGIFDFIFKLRLEIVITSILVFLPLLIKNIYKLRNPKINNKINKDISLFEVWEQSYEYNIKNNPPYFDFQKFLSFLKNHVGIILTSCYVLMNYNFIFIVGIVPSTGITDYLISSNYIAWGIILKGLFIPVSIGFYIYVLYIIDNLYLFYIFALSLLPYLFDFVHYLNPDCILILKDSNTLFFIGCVIFVLCLKPYQVKLRFNGVYVICIIVIYIATMPLTSKFFRKSFYHALLQTDIISENGIDINKKRFKNCEVPLVQVKIGDNYQLYCKFHNNYIRNSYVLLDGVPKFIKQQIYPKHDTPEIIKIYNGDTMLNIHNHPLN